MSDQIPIIYGKRNQKIDNDNGSTWYLLPDTLFDGEITWAMTEKGNFRICEGEVVSVDRVLVTPLPEGEP